MALFPEPPANTTPSAAKEGVTTGMDNSIAAASDALKSFFFFDESIFFSPLPFVNVHGIFVTFFHINNTL